MIGALVLLGLQAATHVGTVKHPPITEQSGIAKSHRYKDTYWVENDSGDSARIFAIHRDGRAIMPSAASKFFVDTPMADKEEWPGITIEGAKNVDWEDILIDGDTLYIPDMGNNGNKRKDLGIYVIHEPNPLQDRSAKVEKYFPVAYPDQKEFPPDKRHFDCESIFKLRGKLYFITKHRMGEKLPGMSAALYRLDTQRTDSTNVLTKVDESDGLTGWVTSAAVSPDQKHVAVLCSLPFQCVWILDTSLKDSQMLSGPKRKISLSGLKQAEGICYDDNNTLLITNEQRDIFEVKL